MIFLFGVLEGPSYKAHMSRTTDRFHTEGNSRGVLGRNDAELCFYKWRPVQRMLHPIAQALCLSDPRNSMELTRKPSNSGKTMSQRRRENKNVKEKKILKSYFQSCDWSNVSKNPLIKEQLKTLNRIVIFKDLVNINKRDFSG